MKKKYSYWFLLLFIIQAFQANAQYQNVRVDDPDSFYPEEVSIAINTANPQFLAAGANINYFYSSTNGGIDWTQKTLSSSLGVYGDPCVIYDGLGYLYFAHLSNPFMGYWIDRIVVQRSADNGLTWNDGAGIGLRSPKNQDKEWLAVDMHSPLYKNNIYAAWTEFDDYGSIDPDDSTRILFSVSSDHGINWAGPILVSDRSGNCVDEDFTVEGAVPTVGPAGEIYLSWAGPSGIMFDRSLDGGRTFGKDIVVDSMPGGWNFSIPGISRSNGFPVTACDTSHSAYRGNIYINWSDQRNGTSNTDIFFTRSTDGGITWNNIKKVNDDFTDRHQFFNWMTIDQTSGVIYICFYDRRNTTGAATDFYVARSADGGETFQNFKVSESSFTPSVSVFFGDYTNIAAYNKKIYPIWMKMDNSILSIITAPIHDSSFVVTSVPEIDDNKTTSFRLEQNYPNPFNPNTTIGYNLSYSTNVTIRVFDILGNELEMLVNEIKPAGSHEVNFSAYGRSVPGGKTSGLNSGIYFYQMSAGNYSLTKKLILMK